MDDMLHHQREASRNGSLGMRRAGRRSCCGILGDELGCIEGNIMTLGGAGEKAESD